MDNLILSTDKIILSIDKTFPYRQYVYQKKGTDFVYRQYNIVGR